MKTESIISIDNVTKTFGAFTAINQISLEVPKGCFMTLLGPSGCGKTTLMRMIAGFHEPDAGDIFIEGARVNNTAANKRKTPLVFQEYALFPHMSVFENIAYGLKVSKYPKTEIKQKVEEMLEMFGLKGMEHRFPKEMSGGQQQRVAFARALIMGQNIILMDEPLSNLDAKMRVEVRNDLRDLQQRTGVTAIFVTHDQDEALSMSDYIAVFNKGTISQIGTPWDIYNKPSNRFVAEFVGVANLIVGEVLRVEGDDITVQCDDHHYTIEQLGHDFIVGEQVELMIRPESLQISSAVQHDSQSSYSIKGHIKKSSFLGRMIRYWVTSGTKEWIVDIANPEKQLEGFVSLILDPSKIHLLKLVDE